MKTLYLVRHTRPAIANGVCYGRLNVGVADEFMQEAERVVRSLPALELVLTSPLQRCFHLADFIAAQRGSEVVADARLQELHFGLWEGRAWTDIARAELDAWAQDVTGYAPPQGESVHQLQQRVSACLRDIAHLPQTQIAVVAHGGSIRAMLAQLANLPIPELLAWQIDYAAVIGVRLPA